MAADGPKAEVAYEERPLAPPVALRANVVHGFKRGSKELGFPTANLCMERIAEAVDRLDTGIYYGWARLGGEVYPAVVSIGWNPYYKNAFKTVEAHLLHQFDSDFYDEELTVLLCGYLRQEADFSSLDALIECIREDIRRAEGHLATAENQAAKDTFSEL